MKFFKSLFNTLLTIVLILAVIMVIALLGVRLIGITPYTVLSGSMEPTYHVGSIIFVKSIDTNELEVGDPITFDAGESSPITHRITEIFTDEDSGMVLYRTKGDANNTEDATPVMAVNIIGKPIFSVPLLGYLSNYIQDPFGRYVVIFVCILFVLFAFLPDVFQKNEKTLDKTKEEGK